MSARASFAFTVKEFADGVPFIAFEPRGGDSDSGVMPSGSFHFLLRRGSTIEQAKELARVCNARIAFLAHSPQ